MARKYRKFVYDENQRFIYPTSDWGFKHLLGTEENKDTIENYMKSILGEAEYEANLEDWKEEGLQEGRIEGRAEGRAEGREEGREEGVRMAAASMLKMGIGEDIICKATGLSPEAVKEL